MLRRPGVINITGVSVSRIVLKSVAVCITLYGTNADVITLTFNKNLTFENLITFSMRDKKNLSGSEIRVYIKFCFVPNI